MRLVARIVVVVEPAEAIGAQLVEMGADRLVEREVVVVVADAHARAVAVEPVLDRSLELGDGAA